MKEPACFLPGSKNIPVRVHEKKGPKIKTRLIIPGTEKHGKGLKLRGQVL